VPSALAAYVAALSLLTGHASPLWCVGAAIVLAVLASLGWRHAGATWLACVVVLAVTACTHVAENSRLCGGIDAAIGSGDRVAFAGTVLGEPGPLGVARYGAEYERWRVVLAVKGWTDDAGVTRPACAQIVVVSGEEWSELGHGDRVTALGELSAASPGRPIAISWNPALVSREGATGSAAAIAHLRNAFRGDARALSPTVRGLTIGMVIGDTSQMDEGQIRAMRVTGLTHLTAVSGAHFAAIALALGFLFRSLGWSRPIRALTLSVVMAGCVALVFPSASVVRAAWMGGVVVVALSWGRPAQALPALSSAVVGLLLIDPYLALSYGFALSVLATASIALWAPILAGHLSRVFTPGLARVVAVPIAAQVACAPVIVLLNPGVGPYAVPANLVAVPCAAATTVLGLLGVVTSVALPGLGPFLASVASIPAWPIAWAADAFANAPAAWLPWPAGETGALLAAVCSGALIAATSARRVAGWARIAAAVAILAVVAAAPPLREAIAGGMRTAPAEWRIAVCDVGQGDAVLLRAGPDSAVMIDVGPPGGAGVDCLRSHGIATVPLLILTHPHADHDGAIREVLAGAVVARAWVSPAAWDEGRDRATAALRAAGVPVSTPAPGTGVSIGWVRLGLWHATHASTYTDSGVNDASLVTWGESDGVTFLDLGDLQAAGQADLGRVAGLSRVVDLVKVAHHGSPNQDPALSSSLAARVAAISVGAGNPYGHPSEVTIALYRRGQTAVLRTDECGEVDLELGGEVSVSAACPSTVAGWGHGSTGREADGTAGLGSGVVVAARPGLGSRAGARRAGDRGNRRRCPIDRRNGLRREAVGGQLPVRGPPRGYKPEPLRRTRSRGCGRGRIHERRVRR
jgi:competence protein ComEC